MELWESYLPAFKSLVQDGNVAEVMCAYQRIDGAPCCSNARYERQILRDEWGFKGVVMSDWNAGTDAVTSMKAGNDMLQPGQERQYKAILEAVQNGTLDEAILNRNVKRILELVVKCHTFENYKYANETDLKAHAIIDRTIGAEGIVLLDNRSALPLTANVKTIALYGTTSYDMVPAGMGFGSTGVGYYCVSLVEGMRNAGYTVDADIIKKYKKMWDKISQMFLIGSLSGIAVLGDVIREYLPVNLILTFGFINVGIMLLKIYFQKKFEEKSLYADNHYD